MKYKQRLIRINTVARSKGNLLYDVRYLCFLRFLLGYKEFWINIHELNVYVRFRFNAISVSPFPSTTNSYLKALGETQPNRKCSLFPANDRNHAEVNIATSFLTTSRVKIASQETNLFHKINALNWVNT